MGLITLYSTMNMIADMITAASAAFGMNSKYWVKNWRARITIKPEMYTIGR